MQMRIKGFKEWIEERGLLSELSPDLLHRAADAGEKKAAATYTPYLADAERERARRFRDAGRRNFDLDLEVVPEGDERSYPVRVVQIRPNEDEDGSQSSVFDVVTSQALVRRKEFGDYGYSPMGQTLKFDARTGDLNGDYPRLRLKLQGDSGERLVARINSAFGTDHEWVG